MSLTIKSAMGLLNMTMFVKNEGLMRRYQLRDSKLMVDGNALRNWAFPKASSKNPAFGNDYEEFAKYIKQLFTNFKDCNVSCYILFNEGHNLSSSMQKTLQSIGKGEKTKKIRKFSTEIMTNVLDELKIPHATGCTDEGDGTIVALAKYFNCPIWTNDSDFFLSPVPIIPFDSCVLVPRDHYVKCNIYHRENFLQKCRMREDMLPILSMLIQKNFKNLLTRDFLKMSKISPHIHDRIKSISIWLSPQTYDSAVSVILQYVPVEDRPKFYEFLQYSKRSIIGAQRESCVFKFIVNSADITVKENDPEWFEKGVVLGHISRPYIDMYKHKIYVYSPEDTFIPCLRILRYAFDLLTGFSGEEFQYADKSCQTTKNMISNELSISEPDRGRDVPFASGWSSLPDYFEHFVRETLPGLPNAAIEELPSDCRLWLLALVWWTMHAARDAAAELHCLLLCRARVVGHCDDEVQLRQLGRTCSFLPAFCQETPHGFALFQYVLNQLDCLNRLCSAPYDPVRYSESYCDSLARGALDKMKAGAEPGAFVVDCLRKSDAAYELYRKLLSTYERCVEAVTANMGCGEQ